MMSFQDFGDLKIIKDIQAPFLNPFELFVGENGNHIYQIIQDYQSQDAGGGYIRLLEIDTKEGTINGKMYSLYYKITKDDYSKISLTGIHFVGQQEENSK